MAKNELKEFNNDTWNSWILEGFKFIRYRTLDKDSVALKPFKEVDPEVELENEEVCFFGIMEDEIAEMADNEIPLLEMFKFYIED